MDIGAIWDVVALQPMINVLIALSDILFGSFGLTIIVLTIVIRGVMYPLTRKQLNATKAMQTLQPKIAELQKKHAKDKQKLAAEQMKLYKESGVSPAGCLLPMLVQMPIWIALYQSIMRVLAVTPDSFLNLSQYLYSWPIVYSALPVNDNFLWLNLADPDFLLAILVGASMWVQQKMSTTASTNPQQKAQGQTMLIMMPLMFIFLSLTFPSGLALYWVVSNIITIVMQYFVTGGWGGLSFAINRNPSRGNRPDKRDKKLKERVAEVEQVKNKDVKALQADIVSIDTANEECGDESGREERQDSRGGYKTSFDRTRQKPRGGKSRRSKRR
ncbi:MAG: YidC/Oxa1 family membrane protein insertase [Dehalococcoidales bacterium]|nr:YidC/Oxa1 family membrane protein insertase [Dehalococcoidales bacterium]